MDIYCGIDFGTTNTVVSICSRKGELIDSFSLTTTLFIPYENQGISKVYIGTEALELYENGKAGRFIHSIKRSLSDRYLQHTTINRRYVKLEELICYFLLELKKIIMDKWCIEPRNIVLGRPVKFSLNEEDNQLANKRLLKSFRLAGFRQITQLEEPVAASLCFEDYFKSGDKSFLIVDLGGGTSDFSLVERCEDQSGIEKYSIKSIDGVNIGGDHFDENIMFQTLSSQLGINSTFESFDKRLPMPVHIYKDVCRWNAMHLFDKKKLADEFSDYLYKSSDPVAVRRLLAIIENKFSHKVLGSVRRCKHDLSRRREAEINFNELDLGISECVKREDLASMLVKPVNSVLSILEKTIGGKDEYNSVDRYILTGGSSRVAFIEKSVTDKAGSDKILMDSNFYDSVSKGLSLYAYFKKISIV